MGEELSRRAVLAGVAAFACRSSPTSAARGADWLWSQQAPDGGFHSQLYGFLRPGGSLTGLCLLALRASGDTVRARRGLDFLRALGPAAPPDYPTYAAALAIAAAHAWGSPAGFEGVRDFLVAQQRAAGFEGHPAYGGFGMGAPSPPTPPHAGHVDLSMTRRALEALAVSGGGPALAAARQFALACRCPDGGFTYSYEAEVNKGDDPRAGYGTATCDGVLALLAAGDPADEPVIETAVGLLRGWFDPQENPGVGGAFSAYGPAMRFYWRAGVAEVFRRRGGPPGWEEALRGALDAEQRPDGSWANASSLQKEDDPLIATALALLAG